MPKSKELKLYEGPTLAEIEALTDLEAEQELHQMNVKPEPFLWNDLSKAQKVERWFNHCWLLEPELRALEPTEKPTTPEQFEQLHKFAVAAHRHSQRGRLIRAHIDRWMKDLSRDELINLINHYAIRKEDAVTLSEKRYTEDHDWPNRLLLVFWPTISGAASKKINHSQKAEE